MASASGYNHHRFARAVLKKSRKWEASLSVELHTSYWRFADSTIPSSILPQLYEIQPPIAFVDGCLVVAIKDFRRTPEVQFRVVMRPAPEGLVQTIDTMMRRRGEGYDERFALEAESRIISATAPPLYLGTSPMASRNANLAMSLTAPADLTLAADGRQHATSALHEYGGGVGGAGVGGSSLGSASDRMRALLRASEMPTRAGAPGAPSAGPGAGVGVGAGGAGGAGNLWLVLRAKERYEGLMRQREREAAAAAEEEKRAAEARANMMNMPGGMMDGSGGPGGGSGQGQQDGQGEEEEVKPKPKPKKKKRPAPEPSEDGQGTGAGAGAATTGAAPSKKKKTAAEKRAEAAAAAKAEETAVDKPAEPEKPKPKPKKKKPAAKAAAEATS